VLGTTGSVTGGCPSFSPVMLGVYGARTFRGVVRRHFFHSVSRSLRRKLCSRPSPCASRYRLALSRPISRAHHAATTTTITPPTITIGFTPPSSSRRARQASSYPVRCRSNSLGRPLVEVPVAAEQRPGDRRVIPGRHAEARMAVDEARVARRDRDVGHEPGHQARAKPQRRRIGSGLSQGRHG